MIAQLDISLQKGMRCLRHVALVGEKYIENFGGQTWKARFGKKEIILHQDSAPAHKSVLAMGKLRDLHYELLEHPPCSPDLAPSDFYLFPKLKLFLAGQRFSSNQEAIADVEGYFADLTKNHYKDGIMALEHRWNKYISLKGDYVKK